MTVFRYDKTFEGLLTAVFDAYARRMAPSYFPDALIGSDQTAPLFTTDDHTVVSDPDKAGRVWRALQKKLPHDVVSMLSMGWLSEEPGVDMMLMRYIRRIFDSREKIFTDFADPDILRIKQLATRVDRERKHLMQFTRFQKGGDGTFFAPVSPLYNVLPLVIPWFADRFRDQLWLIYDIRRRYGFYYDLETTTEVTIEDDAHLLSGQLDEALLAENEKLFQSGWRGYIDGMAIKERINPKLQRQHMPQRFWPLLTEKQ
jgi:probable DNA metabolism protein